MIEDKQLCLNCLYPHQTDTCTSIYSCRHCGQRHNSILHAETSFHITTDSEIIFDPDEQQALEMEQLICTHIHSEHKPTNILCCLLR